MPDPVLVFDRDGRYMHTNPAGARLVRVARDALIGRRFGEAHGSRDPGFENAFQRVASGERETETVTVYFAPFDLWTENRLARLGEYVICFTREISDLQRAEHEREAMMKRLALLAEASRVFAAARLDPV